MRVYVFEGTPEEIREAVKALPEHHATAQVEVWEEDHAEAEAGPAERTTEGWAGVDLARRALSRRPLSEELQKVLVALYEANLDRVSAPTLQGLIKYSRSQFSGMMGAFGRRLTHTRGYVDPTWFFDREWDQDNGHNTYRLPESVREAMRLEQLV